MNLKIAVSQYVDVCSLEIDTDVSDEYELHFITAYVSVKIVWAPYVTHIPVRVAHALRLSSLKLTDNSSRSVRSLTFLCIYLFILHLGRSSLIFGTHI